MNKRTELLEKAREIASRALEKDLRSNGSPMLGHADGVVAIVRDEIGLGEESLAAVYLHEATRFHPEVDISGFPAEIRTIVDGLNKISVIKPKDTRLEAENYKKLIVQYSSDPRVTVLKIADRLEIMRSLSILPRNKREQKILETVMLYIPLAHQLGLYNIKSEMEDIYFKYAEPEQFKLISRKLKETEKARKRLLDEFIKPLEEKLSAAGISYKLKIRTKTAYSIYRKMSKQGVPFEGVYDVFAIRFIIDCPPVRELEQDLCWKVYSYVTEEYVPDSNRLRDWISNPKPNGYESLHITVRNSSGEYLEVQIRTKRMDDTAESGLASHWSYKGIKTDGPLANWLSSVRYQLEHPVDTKPEDIPKPPSNEIFVYTPTGELRILPAGATVLDFAFNIHTGLGCRCTGGRVNGRVVPIKYILQTGDVVEILSSKSQRPSPDWINWVVSGKARAKIKIEIDADLRKRAAEGREMLFRRIKNWKLALPDDLLYDIMHFLKYSSVITFMGAIAEGKVDVNDIKAFILNPDSLVIRQTHEEKKEGAKPDWTPTDEILVINAKNVKGLEYKMASCCNPKHGDEVFGFVTRTEGIKIHREDCPNARRMKDLYPYRVQKVIWQDKEG